MKTKILTLSLILIAFVSNAQTKSKVYNCSALGVNDGSIDMIVSGGTPPFTYQWSNGSTDEDLKNLSSGRYTCTLSDASGICKIEVSFDVAADNPFTKRKEDAYTSRFEVYPNPAESITNIVFYNSDDNAFTIRIMDINGKEIYSQNVNEVNGEFQKQFDFSSYAKGIYLVEIISKKESITKRILIN
jgi:hypothetical protein